MTTSRLPLERTTPTAAPTAPANLLPLAVGIVLSQVADLVTFIAAIPRTGIAAESNAIARELFLRAGVFGPALLKTAAVLLILLLVRRVALRFPQRAALAGWVAIGLGIIGASSNVLFGLVLG